MGTNSISWGFSYPLMPRYPISRGPWEYRPVPGLRTIVIAQAGIMHSHARVTMNSDNPGPLGPTEYANARLIAKAPELIEVAMWAESAFSRLAITSSLPGDREGFHHRFTATRRLLDDLRGQ